MVAKRTVAAMTAIFTWMLIAACLFAQDVHATSTVVIAPSGSGEYALQGVGMEGVSAMDIVVSYDPATLTKPRVAQGSLISGAIIAVNDTVAGQVRIGIIRITPVQGTGTIATLTFDRIGAKPGKILSVTAKFSNSDSQPLDAAARVSDAAEPVDTASQPGPGEKTGRPASITPPNSAPITAGGSVPVLVQPGAPSPERQKDEAASAAVTAAEPVAGAADPASPALGSPEAAGMTASSEQGNNIKQLTRVLDRFREYRGARTVKAMSALFDQNDASAEFKQEPKVVLSDGKATAKIYFTFRSPGGVAPDFALNSARLISMRRDGERPDAWVAEVKPEKGAYSASIIVSRSGELREFPLTLAPKVEPEQKAQAEVTEKTLGAFLSGKGRDLNRDGKRDYIDDYIYTANYVASRQAAKKTDK